MVACTVARGGESIVEPRQGRVTRPALRAWRSSMASRGPARTDCVGDQLDPRRSGGATFADTRPYRFTVRSNIVRVCHVLFLSRYHVRTAVARIVRAHELRVRGISLAWGEGAPIPAALRADAHCTCCGSTQAFPERSRMMMSGPPLPTLALGRSAKRALHRASRAARSARRLRRPHHQEATRAVIGGEHM